MVCPAPTVTGGEAEEKGWQLGTQWEIGLLGAKDIG